MVIFRAVAFGITLVSQSTAFAADSALERYKNYLPQQIIDLPEKERTNEVPMNLIGAARLAVSEAGDLVTKAHLNSLMYSGLADYEGAKRAFQQDLGEEPTGNLTVGQLNTLYYRAQRLNLTYVSFFAADYGGVMSGSLASVRGTLKILDERIAYPINNVSVTCNKDQGYCRYEQVALILPDKDSFAQSYVVQEIASETYQITRWENNQIDAIPYDNSACRINQLSFNFATKEYFEIARNNTAGDCETALGVTLPRLEKPRVSQIVKGDEIVAAEFKRLNDEAAGYYSSTFRKQIEALAAKSAKSSRTK